MSLPIKSLHLKELFEELVEELPKIRNYPKTVITLPNDHYPFPVQKLVTMQGVVEGFSMVKYFHIDEVANQKTGKAILYSPTGNVLAEIDATLLTNIRAALMACLVVIKAGVTPEVVAFVGTGNINQLTAKFMRELFGSQHFLLLNSKANPDKGFSPFKEVGEVEICKSIQELSQADVLICCSNNIDRGSLHNEFEGDLCSTESYTHFPLTITQDSGYTLGDKFRQRCELYTDDYYQLNLHLADEFPFDEELPNYHRSILHDNVFLPANVCLYGLGSADVFVLRKLWELGYV